MGNIPAKISGKYQSYDINTPSQVTPSLPLNTSSSRKQSSTSSSFQNNASMRTINDTNNNSNASNLKTLNNKDQRTSYLLSQTIENNNSADYDEQREHSIQEKISQSHDDYNSRHLDMDDNKENFTVYEKNTLPVGKKLYNDLDDSLSDHNDEDSHHESNDSYLNQHQQQQQHHPQLHNQHDDDDDEEEIFEEGKFFICYIIFCFI